MFIEAFFSVLKKKPAVTCLMRTRNDMLLNAAQTLELIDQEKFNLYKKIKRNIQQSFLDTGVFFY